MYKPLLATFAAAAILTACSSGESIADNSAIENEQSFKSIQSESAKNTELQDLASLPEFTVIDEKIGADSLEFEIVSNSPGKRILLLNSGSKEYKSIFVKETKRLKIIDLDGEGLVFNDILEVR